MSKLMDKQLNKSEEYLARVEEEFEHLHFSISSSNVDDRDIRNIAVEIVALVDRYEGTIKRLQDENKKLKKKLEKYEKNNM